MENITLGTISGVVAFVVALITGIGYISSRTKQFIQSALSEQMSNIDKRFDAIEDKLSLVDMESTKNYLVTVITELDKGQWIDEIERARFLEQYEHYAKIGGNSYIKRKVEELIEKKAI